MDFRSLDLKSRYSVTWTHQLCEICLKNAHNENRVVMRTVVSPNDATKQEDFYVCTSCGSTRKI